MKDSVLPWTLFNGIGDTTMEKSKKNPRALLVIAVAFVVAFLGNYPQFQLSPLSGAIMEQYGLSQTQFLSAFSASMMPGILFSLVSGVLCDKFGVKKCIGVASIIVCIALIGRTASYNYPTLMACMLCAGLAGSFLNSNVNKLLSKWVAPEKMGAMVGLVLAGTPLAQFVGMSTTAYLPSVKVAFIVAAVLSIVVAIAWIAFVKDAPEQTVAVTAKQTSAPISLGRAIGIVTANKNIWIIGFSLFFMMGSIIALSSFLPLALQSIHGFSTQKAGTVTSVVMLGSLIGTVIGPMICAKLNSVKLYVFVCGILAGAGAAVALYISSLPLILLVFFVIGFTSNSIIPIMIAHVMSLGGVTFEIAGTAGGVVATIQILGTAVLPTYVIAPIAGDNFYLYFILVGVCSALSGVIALLLPRNRS